jgi:sirohydrochlorin cobaltochelatase
LSDPTGIVLFAHGSRDARWREPIEAVAATIARREPGVRVACAYLELVEPDLASAVDQMAATGVKSIRLVPLFLGMGKHLREDLPGLVDGLRAAHPTVRFALQAPVGENRQLIDLLATIALDH